MKQKNCSFFCLLISTMLLFSFSSLFAAVTVTYQNASFPYNTTGNVITAQVNTSDNIAAFDLMTKVRSTVNYAFGKITAVNVSAVAGAVANTSKVHGNCPPVVISEDTTRIYGFDCNVATIMPAGLYNFTFTVATCCSTGTFVLEDGGTWLVDPDPVNATSMFVKAIDATAAGLTVNPGTYQVISRPPTVDNCPTQALYVNACLVVNYDFDASDPDTPCRPVNDLTWSIPPGFPGSINASTGQFVWDPPAIAGICGIHQGRVIVTDEWGVSDTCDFDISLWTDPPHFVESCWGAIQPGQPYCACIDSTTAHIWDVWGNTLSGDLEAVDPDNCPLALKFSFVNFTGPGTIVLDSMTGHWEWQTVFGDTAYLGVHTVTFSVTDGCATDTCSFELNVTGIRVEIAKLHKQLQGHYAFDSISVFADGTMGDLGGFDFLIAYDNSALSPISVFPGPEIAGKWEYFTWRFGANGNCSGSCPKGLLRIVAIADINNGIFHPLPADFNINGVVAVIKFLVTNDRTFDCQYIPVAFYWIDCGDNSLSDKTGNFLYISRNVYWYTGDDFPANQYELISSGPFAMPGYGGWRMIDGSPNCLLGQKYKPLEWVDFYDGGIDIICKDSIDARGDINLNGIMNEIADAVLYTNYFLYGMSALDPVFFEAQRAASDVNNDGVVLTVGDLVYLLRIIVGDALPFAKLAPFSAATDVVVMNGKISTTSSEAIGALYMTFDVKGNYAVVPHTDMKVEYNLADDGMLHVLVYSGTEKMTNSIPSGTNALLTVTGAELSSVEAADYNGNLMNVRVEKTALPTQFALQQNVPNPFNPTTKIGLDLPVISDWKLDIYNVNGQLVQSYNGTNIGHFEVTWDASNVASGIYFYKLTAGSFTDTKKMVLMK